jgi:signal recognition particle receptor subunit beta
MVSLNYSTMGMTAKVVYYGPGLGGKTTNLKHIYDNTSTGTRGEMVLMETESDRTLFFDLLPLEVGSMAGFRTKVQLYTVPGQVFYNDTRKLVLRGVDGVVFVADSQRPMMQANLDSLSNLRDNLAGLGMSIDQIPLVMQYNKRDLDGSICSVEELNEQLNPSGRLAWFEASAVTGLGVFETLKEISRLTLRSLKDNLADPTVSTGRNGKRRARAAARSVAQSSLGENGNGRGGDALAALERIRRSTLEDRAGEIADGQAGNGNGTLRRSVAWEASRAQLRAARKVLLNLRVPGDNGTDDLVRELELELEPRIGGDRLHLQLDIALDAED